MNQAIHNVDLIYWFMGDVAEVAAITDTLAHERIEVEDVGVAAVRFKNGALGTHRSHHQRLSRLAEEDGNPRHARLGDRRTGRHPDVGLRRKSRPRTAVLRKKFARKVGGTGGASDPTAISYVGHMEQIKDFLKAIETGSKPLVDGEEGRKSVEIILAIYKSSWTGKRVGCR